MQYKLLQFYKVLSNFSTNLISGFIPLIVYKSTQNVILAVGSLVLGYLATIGCNFLLRKALYKYPELCLCLRILPIIGMQVVLLFINVSPILMIIVFSIFYGLNYTLKTVPCEVIYSYSVPPNTSSTKLGLTRVFEQTGFVLSAIVGGLFLDNIPTLYVVIISLTLYLIASLPLMIYYIKNKGKGAFNTEVVSTAFIYYESKDESLKGKKVSKKITLMYFTYYALACGVDAFYRFFSFATYLATGSFLVSGVLSGSCDAIHGIMVFVAAKLDEKFDLTVLASISSFVMAACIVVATLTIGLWPSFVCFLLIPVFWPIPAIFINQRMLAKSKILGITNDCNFIKYNGHLAGQTFCYMFGLTGFVWLIFVAGACLMVAVGITSPIIEEKTRKILVDYIENN